MSTMTQSPDGGAQAEPLRVLIIYYSRFGTIADLAAGVREGAERHPRTVVDMLALDDEPYPELQRLTAGGDAELVARRSALLARLARTDALVIGGPAYFGSMASPLKRFFEDCTTASGAILDRTRPWHHYLFRDRAGAAFTSSATPHGGNESALHSMLTMLMHLQMIVVTPGQRGPILEQPASPYGAIAITGPTGHNGLSDEELAEARDLGQRVAVIGARLSAGLRLEEESLHAATIGPANGYDPSA